MESVSISVTTCRANFAEIIQLFFLFTLISCCLQVITRKVGQMQFQKNYAGTSSQHSNGMQEPASETLNSWMLLLNGIKFFAESYSGSGSSSDDSYCDDPRFYILQILSRCALCQRWTATPQQLQFLTGTQKGAFLAHQRVRCRHVPLFSLSYHSTIDQVLSVRDLVLCWEDTGDSICCSDTQAFLSCEHDLSVVLDMLIMAASKEDI